MPGVGICQVVPTRTRIDGTVAVDQTVRPLPLIPTSRNMSPTCGGTFPESGGKLDQTVAGSGDHIIKSPVTEPTGVNHGQAEPSGMTTSDLDYYVVEYLMRCSQALIRNIEQEFGVTVKCVNRVCEDIVTVAFQRFNPVIKVENEEKAQQEFLSLYEGTYRNIVQRTIHVSSASPSNKTAEYFVNLVTNTNTDKMKIVAIATGTNDVMLVGPYETVSMVENFIHSQLDGDRRTVEGTIARPEVTSGTGLMEEHDSDDDDDYYYYSQHHDVDYFEYTCNDKVKVKIYTADITKLTVDVIVNAANERLLNYGGVAGAIERVGGEQLRDDCQRIVDRDGPLKVAEVVHTVARGRLKCRYVVHTVGPMWMLSSDKALCATLLQHTFENVLHYSNHVLKAKTLAVPAIGSGIFEVPLDVSAQTMFKAIQELTEKVSEFTLHEIHLVNNDTNTTHLIRTIFEHLLTTTSQPTPASSTREDSRDKVVLAADVGSPEALKDECGRDISKSVEKDDESRKKGHKDVDHEVEGIRLEKSEKVYELDNLTEELSLEDRNLNPLIDKTDSDIKSSTGKLGFDLETAPGENDVDLETATGNTNHDLDGDNVEIVKSAVDGCGFDTELSCLPKSTYSEAEKCQPSSDSDLNPGRDG
jgi:O-acetyl-ADP-ribose deacetylase (regulator of RNase III)